MLTDQELFERQALYETALNVRKELAALEQAVPINPPGDLLCGSEALPNEVNEALTRIVLRTWSALRDSALDDARRAVALMDDRVRRFEAGEDV